MVDENPLIDRDRGIFTSDDRKILLDEKEVESGTQQERNIRMRMRQRLTDSLIDFALALEEMEQRDIEKVINGDRSNEEQRLIDRGMDAAIGLIHWQTERNTPPRDFESILKNGLRRSLAARHRDSDATIRAFVSVNFDTDEEVHNIDDIHRRYETSGEAVTGREKTILREEGLIDSPEISVDDHGGGFVGEDKAGDLRDEWGNDDDDDES